MIIGMNLEVIEATRRVNNISGEVGISSTPVIESIEKADMNIPGLSDVLSIKFKFKTLYEPKIGEIIVGGELLYSSDENKKILKDWEKEKKLSKDVAVEVLNTIFRKCLMKSVQIADDLRLPPPMQLPVVRAEEPKTTTKTTVKEKDNEERYAQ